MNHGRAYLCYAFETLRFLGVGKFRDNQESRVRVERDAIMRESCTVRPKAPNCGQLVDVYSDAGQFCQGMSREVQLQTKKPRCIDRLHC